MEIDRRLLTCDTSSLIIAAGFNSCSSGGAYGQSYFLSFKDPATGASHRIEAKSYEELRPKLVSWLAEHDRLPSFAEVELARLERTIGWAEARSEREDARFKVLTDIVSGVLGQSFNADPCIRIWAFHTAPACFQELSTNGGDEDWIAHVPKDMGTPHWFDTSWMNSPDVHELPDGSSIYIWAHA